MPASSLSLRRSRSCRACLQPAGSRWGEGAHSALEQLLLDRAKSPSAWREEHPGAARRARGGPV